MRTETYAQGEALGQAQTPEAHESQLPSTIHTNLASLTSAKMLETIDEKIKKEQQLDQTVKKEERDGVYYEFKPTRSYTV